MQCMLFVIMSRLSNKYIFNFVYRQKIDRIDDNIIYNIQLKTGYPTHFWIENCMVNILYRMCI